MSDVVFGASIMIPARLPSTRLPRKALADIAGKPMIQHVYERVSQARTVQRVVVATGSEEVMRAVKAEHVSKKFCHRLKRSLWYGVQDLAGEMLGRRNEHAKLRKNELAGGVT